MHRLHLSSGSLLFWVSLVSVLMLISPLPSLIQPAFAGNYDTHLYADSSCSTDVLYGDHDVVVSIFPSWTLNQVKCSSETDTAGRVNYMAEEITFNSTQCEFTYNWAEWEVNATTCGSLSNTATSSAYGTITQTGSSGGCIRRTMNCNVPYDVCPPTSYIKFNFVGQVDFTNGSTPSCLGGSGANSNGAESGLHVPTGSMWFTGVASVLSIVAVVMS